MALDRIGEGVALRSKGDIVSHDGTSLIVLPVGDDAKILTAQTSTASGLFWDTNAASGGGTEDWAPIGYVEHTSSANPGTLSLTISSIPGTYKDLLIYIVASQHSDSYADSLRIRFNGATSSTNHIYNGRQVEYSGTSGNTETTFSESGTDGNVGKIRSFAFQVLERDSQSFGKFYIPDYASATNHKIMRGTIGTANYMPSGEQQKTGRREVLNIFSSTSPITQVTISMSGTGYLDYRSSMHIYGLKG